MRNKAIKIKFITVFIVLLIQILLAEQTVLKLRRFHKTLFNSNIYLLLSIVIGSRNFKLKTFSAIQTE